MTSAIARGREVEVPEVLIEPPGRWAPLQFRELWAYRELLYFLVWREIKLRYKQTAIGAAWAIIQPLFTMVVFSIFFWKLANMPSDGVAYPVFAFCALLPWQLFAFSVTEASNSVVANQRLLTKVYFPRLIMPVAAMGAGVVDFCVSFVVLLGLSVYYSTLPSIHLWSAPLWGLLACLTALAAGLWLSALNVRYRDVRYAVPFLVQLWMFASPVAYPTSLVPPQWRPFYAINPMVAVIDGFRWAIVGAPPPSPSTVFVSILTVAVVLIGGLFYFRRMERTFADLV